MLPGAGLLSSCSGEEVPGGDTGLGPEGCAGAGQVPSGLGNGPGAGPAASSGRKRGLGLGRGEGREKQAGSSASRPDGPFRPSEGWTERGERPSGCQLMCDRCVTLCVHLQHLTGSPGHHAQRQVTAAQAPWASLRTALPPNTADLPDPRALPTFPCSGGGGSSFPPDAARSHSGHHQLMPHCPILVTPFYRPAD